MSEKYKARDDQPYFITFVTVGWLDIFTRERFRKIITESLLFCIENKGLVLHEYVVLPSHIHLIVQHKGSKLSDVIRDFKAFTATKIIQSLKYDTGESRSEWILRLFKYFAKNKQQNKDYMVWQKSNRPIVLDRSEIYAQKKDYLLNNPVTDGFVYKAEDWKYSSAGWENPLAGHLSER